MKLTSALGLSLVLLLVLSLIIPEVTSKLTKNIFIQKHQPQPTSLKIIKVESILTSSHHWSNLQSTIHHRHDQHQHQHDRQQDHGEHVQVESKSIRPHRGALARAGRGGAGRGIRYLYLYFHLYAELAEVSGSETKTTILKTPFFEEVLSMFNVLDDS